MKIPLYKPQIGEKEKEAVDRVLASNKLARGPEVNAFENEFASYVQKKYAVALNSGTSGLQVLVRAMGWTSGDEVITTSFSYIASSNCLLLEGVTPIFVDIDPRTLNIDPSKIEVKITSRTKGILLVHILGLPVDPEPIFKIAKKHKLHVIEDACECIGRPGEDFSVGKFSASVYGFHENKQLTSAGEGGMIVTNDVMLAQRCAALRDQGRSFEKDWKKHVILGHNFRLTEAQAAFGRAQLEKLDEMLVRREEIASIYYEELSNEKGIVLPQDMVSNKRSWFLYFVFFKNPKDRERACDILDTRNISYSTNYFPPIDSFQIYENHSPGDLEYTIAASKSVLALPTYCDMKDEEVRFVADAIKDALK